MTHLNADPAELAKFGNLAAHWWDVNGDLRTLHQINPIRLNYIDKKAHIAGKTVLDVGCGGGILAESMAALGAKVTAIDLDPDLISVAKLHTLETKINVDYRKVAVEELATELPQYFDVITCMEMLEHVPDPISIIAACSKLLKPGGHIFFSTLNRNPKSYLFAIIGAEYVLRMLPKNTHDYSKFIRPSELNNWSRDNLIKLDEIKGISYNLLTKQFKLSDDISVNYLCHGLKD